MERTDKHYKCVINIWNVLDWITISSKVLENTIKILVYTINVLYIYEVYYIY